MNDKKIIIPNVECMNKENLKELIDFLENCPLDYEMWERSL